MRTASRSCLSFLVLLAACSSGGTEAEVPDPFAVFDETFAEVTASPVTPLSQFPTAGDVQYMGAMLLDLPIGTGRSEYLGDLSVTANFESVGDPLTGRLGNLTAENGDQLSGQLTINNGTIFGDVNVNTDFLFNAEISGNLSDDGSDYFVAGELAGDFHGQDAATIAGLVFGDVTTAGEVDTFDGTFVAAR